MANTTVKIIYQGIDKITPILNRMEKTMRKILVTLKAMERQGKRTYTKGAKQAKTYANSVKMIGNAASSSLIALTALLVMIHRINNASKRLMYNPTSSIIRRNKVNSRWFNARKALPYSPWSKGTGGSRGPASFGGGMQDATYRSKTTGGTSRLWRRRYNSYKTNFDAKMNSSFYKTMSRTRQLGMNMAYVIGLPAMLIGGASAKMFMTLENGFMKVQSLMNPEQLKQYSGQWKELQHTLVKTGFGIEDISKAMFAGPSALGFKGTRAFDTLNAASTLALAGFSSLEAATNGIITVMQVYGDEVENAADAANKLFVGQIYGRVDVQQITNALGDILPIAQAVGVSLDESIAGFVALTAGGLSAARSATAWKRMIQSITLPRTARARDSFGKAQRVMNKMIARGDYKDIGVTAPIRLKYSIEEIKAGRKSGKSIFPAFMKDLAFIAKVKPLWVKRMVPEMRGLLGVLLSSGKEAQARFVETLKALETQKGSKLSQVEIKAKFREQSATYDFEATMGELKLLGEKIGRKLLPIINRFLKAIIGIGQAFDKFVPDGMKRKILMFLAIFTAIIIPLTLIISLIGMLGTALVAVFGIGAIGAGPVIIAIIAISYAIMKLISSITESEESLNSWQKTWDNIKRTLRAIWNILEAISDLANDAIFFGDDSKFVAASLRILNAWKDIKAIYNSMFGSDEAEKDKPSIDPMTGKPSKYTPSTAAYDRVLRELGGTRPQETTFLGDLRSSMPFMDLTGKAAIYIYNTIYPGEKVETVTEGNASTTVNNTLKPIGKSGG